MFQPFQMFAWDLSMDGLPGPQAVLTVIGWGAGHCTEGVLHQRAAATASESLPRGIGLVAGSPPERTLWHDRGTR